MSKVLERLLVVVVVVVVGSVSFAPHCPSGSQWNGRVCVYERPATGDAVCAWPYKAKKVGRTTVCSRQHTDETQGDQ